MPYKSEAQRRYIFMKAAEGAPWAIKFIKDMGQKPPALRTKKVKPKARKKVVKK